MVDWLWWVPVLGALALLLAVAVSARAKLAHDLAIIEKVRALELDPHRTLETYLRASFGRTFQFVYGWLGLAPMLLKMAAYVLAAATVGYAGMMAVGDAWWGQAALALVAAAYVYWYALRMERRPDVKMFALLGMGEVSMDEPIPDEEE